MKKETLATSGSLAAAFVASLCCFGPLVLVALGVSGGILGTLAGFHRYRPIFVPLALLLFGAAGYWTYRQQRACAKSEACTPEMLVNQRRKWLVLGFLALVILFLAFFPEIRGYLGI